MGEPARPLGDQQPSCACQRCSFSVMGCASVALVTLTGILTVTALLIDTSIGTLIGTLIETLIVFSIGTLIGILSGMLIGTLTGSEPWTRNGGIAMICHGQQVALLNGKPAVKFAHYCASCPSSLCDVWKKLWCRSLRLVAHHINVR